MMVAEVSVAPGAGAAPAELPAQAASAAAGAGAFAALVAQAAAAAAEPPAQAAARPAERFVQKPEGIVHCTLPADWCLAALEPAAPEAWGVEPVDGAGEVEPAEDTGEREAHVAEDATEAQAVVAWPPVGPVPEVKRTALGLTGTAFEVRPEVQVEPAPAAAVQLTPAEEAGASAASTSAAAGARVGGGLEPASGPALSSEGSRGDARTPAAAPRADLPTMDVVPAPQASGAETIAAAAAPGDGATPTSTDTAPASVEAEPRRSGAAVQLRRAMERLGLEAGAPAAQQESAAVSGDGGSAHADGENPGAAARTPVWAPAGAGTPLHGDAPAFGAQFAGELTRYSAVAAAGSVTAPPSSEPAPDADTTQQIVQAMRLQFRDGVGTAVVHLKPGHLGEVSISLRVEQQAVSATVHAEVPAVRQWLESQEASLRSGLSEQGLRLEEFVVREDESRRQGSGSAEQEDPQRAKRPQRQGRTNGEPKFEVVV